MVAALFGPMLSRFDPKPIFAQQPQAAPRPRRGLFGGLLGGKRDWNDTLQTLGATLQQMDGGSELTDYLSQRDANRRENDLFGMQVRRFKQDEADAERQRADVDAAIGSLDPSLQPWARLAPDAAARRALTPPDPVEYEIDAQGRPYTIQGGRVVFGEGRVAVPQTGGTNRAPPAGYRWTPGGDLEAIPGGPADLRANESGRRQAGALRDSENNLSNVLGAIDEALPQVSESTTGVWSRRAGQWGLNQGNVDLENALDPVRANLGFEALQEMRRNSETGGALGQVAVRELELLQRTVRSLETEQSGAQLAQNLRTVRAQIERARNAVAAARQELEGGAVPQQQTQQPRIIELDP